MNKIFRKFFYLIVTKITREKFIVDVTGTILTPGNCGKDCLGNGEHYNRRGEIIECCCDECDYFLCCADDFDMRKCELCTDKFCTRKRS